MDAYVEEYGDRRGHRHHRSQRDAPISSRNTPPIYVNDWKSSNEPAKPYKQKTKPTRYHHDDKDNRDNRRYDRHDRYDQDHDDDRSPYLVATKPDLHSSESRASSRQWSRTSSSLKAATSTMPSTAPTTTRSSRREASARSRKRSISPPQHSHHPIDRHHQDDDEHGPRPYRPRGSEPERHHDEYDDWEDDEDEDKDIVVEEERDIDQRDRHAHRHRHDYDEPPTDRRTKHRRPSVTAASGSNSAAAAVDAAAAAIAAASPSRRESCRRAPSTKGASTRHRHPSESTPQYAPLIYPPSRDYPSGASISGSDLDTESEDDDGLVYNHKRSHGHDHEDISDESSSSTDASESEEEDNHAQQMPTIPEDDGMKERLRSRSSMRRPQVVVDDHALPEAPAAPQEQDILEPPLVPAEKLDRRGEAESHHHHHQSPPRGGVSGREPGYDEDFHVRDDDCRRKSSNRRRSSRYEDPEVVETPRRSRHKSQPMPVPSAHPDDYLDDDAPRRAQYQRDDRQERKHRRHHPHHGGSSSRHKSRTSSPVRNRLESPQKPSRRRSSMDDFKYSQLKKSGRRYSASDNIHGAPNSSRKSYSSKSHEASSNTVSTSKRPSFRLGSILGLSHQRAAPPVKSGKKVPCVVCMDDFSSADIPKLKCGHRMCSSCLERSFKLSLTDPQHMPPKCCTEDQIPILHVEHLFDSKFKRKWNQKLTESNIKNRLYCPSRNCGHLLLPRDVMRSSDGRKRGICPKCHTKVCPTCSGKWHRSKECPSDPETTKFLTQAKENGWKRCYKCKAVVELKEGCNHMTCRCGAEFCMHCGVKWKRCDCDLFNINNLDDEQDMDPADIRVMPRRNGNPFAPLQVPIRAPFAPQPLEPPTAPIAPVRETHARPERRRPGSARQPRAPRQHDLAESTPTPRRRRRRSADGGYSRRRPAQDPYLERYRAREAQEQGNDAHMDIVGLGNHAGHFMNDNYVRAPMTMDPTPAVPEPPEMIRTAATTGFLPDNARPRGHRRVDSQGQRLADRFASHGYSPYRPSGPFTAPPGPISHIGGAPMPPASALSSGITPIPHRPMGRPVMRRHTFEEDIYNNGHSPQPADMAAPPQYAQHYEEEPMIHSPSRRRPDPPKSSILAGLTGEGRGMNRVFEWRTHVSPDFSGDLVTV